MSEISVFVQKNDKNKFFYNLFNEFDSEKQHIDKKATMEEIQALCPGLIDIVEDWQLNEVKAEPDESAPF